MTVESSFITITYMMLAVTSAFLYQHDHGGCYLTFSFCEGLENFFCGGKGSMNTWLISRALMSIPQKE